MEPPFIGLTAFQVAVAEMFFALPESDGFLLAGGAAPVAQQLTQRATHDLDLFTRSGRSTVPSARDALERAAADCGWSVRRIRDDGDSQKRNMDWRGIAASPSRRARPDPSR